MLVLTPKYGSQIDLDLLKKQKKEPQVKHRNDIIYLNLCKDIKEAYQTFLKNKDKYIIGYKPKDADEINKFVKSRKKDTLDVSWIDVSDLESLELCFINCNFKQIIGLDKWDVSNVKDMHQMFRNCVNVEYVKGLESWDVSNVTNMDAMFCWCHNLERLDLSEWNFSNVSYMSNMFYCCRNLETLGYISEWDVSSVKYMDGMFVDCINLKSIREINEWNVSKVENMKNMFKGCTLRPLPVWYNN